MTYRWLAAACIVACLPEGSLPRQVLSTSLSTRRAVRRYEALAPRADVATFLAAIAEVSASNRALGTALDSLNPKASSYCTDYSQTLDSFIGHGRDIAWDVRAGGNWSRTAERFAEYYNRSVKSVASCQKEEARAQS